MKAEKILSIAVLISLSLLCSAPVFADTPAPPVNQRLGFDDTVFNNLAEADCRLCHDDPAVTGPTPNADRHHLLYGGLLPLGVCSVNGTACLSDADCDAAICSAPPVEACSADADCDKVHLGETCGEVCIGETAVPVLDANQDGVDDTAYGCLNCHRQETSGGITTFIVERDCSQCHIQSAGEGSVHHLLPIARGLNSPLGDPAVGDCTPCHGTAVDDIGDGHAVPIYDPSLVTPVPSGGAGLPLNSSGNGAGACNYCHDAGTDNATGISVFNNAINHHNTGVFQSETGVVNDSACLWCHDLTPPPEDSIRTCEGCHGYESLHNIQADSDGSGDIVVGGELYGYGHIGADDPGAGSDCWGCHGFAFAGAAAPGSGPTTPFIGSADPMVTAAGTDTQITLSGTAFTNVYGTTQYTAVVELTAGNGAVIGLIPDAVSESTIAVTVPGTLAAGNYEVRAVKNTAVSNPIVISVVPPVMISQTMCALCAGTVTINGSGFGDYPPEGTAEFLNVVMDGMSVEIVDWSDTAITVKSSCNVGSVTVNALFGSATQAGAR